MNHSFYIHALRNNENGAKTKFLSELVRIMQKYPWCAGVDIDLERGGGYENKDAANILFAIYTKPSKRTIPPNWSISVCPV